jgi:hypothetical protein
LHADRVERVGADRHDVRIGGLDRAHDRGEIGGGRRIAAVIDHLEAELRRVGARALAGVVGELRVSRDERDGRRLRILRRRGLEEAEGERGLRVRTRGDHGEELRILELGVHREPEQDDEHLALLHDHRHGGRRHVGRIGTDHEVDLVDVEQLGVDARNGRRIGLIVVEDELHRSPEQSALGVDLLFPDLHAEQRLLAVGGERAGQRHGEADGDRIAALRAGRRHEGERGHQAGRDTGQNVNPKLLKHRAFLP